MNNYAVSSDGIAIALQDSASALMEAGNNFEQSVALIAAANKVVQDPNSVGSALRTISLRLRGTSVEVLEELGEETDGAVESVSKMQAKLKALTGVDILTDSGAYKDTYTILKDIATVWDDMSNMDQAAALELMAGKNRANTLAAILNNIEDLEGAYESALKAEGSALRENEAYLDSIQGRLDLFTNALQTFWMNFIDSSTIKGIVDIGTALIKLLDTAHGKIIALAGALAIYKKFKDKTKFSDMFKGAVDAIKNTFSAMKSIISGTKALTVATTAQTIASKIQNKELAQSILVNSGLAAADGKLTKELIKKTAATLTDAFATGKLTAAQYLATMSTMGLKTALQGLWQVLIKNPIYLIAAAVAAAALAFDHFHTTAQEAADAAKEAFDEIQSVVEATESTIQSLESELSTLQDKIDELDGKKLSYADEQELEKLQKQREELEHSLKVQKQLLELQRESSNKQAIASMKAYTKAASEGAKETQKTATTWGTIAGVVGGALLTIGGLALIPVSGGTSSALSAMGASTIATSVGVGAAAGGLAGNKAGEAIGSNISENEGTYDSWYETYTKALETARKEEQEALKKYQNDPSSIKKLDKWQEAQQKASDIETEMYEHLSQMQQYYNDLEYGVSDEIDRELDTWYNFLDKFSIDQGASGAEVTALDRIFGENSSEELQSLKEKILDAVSAGKEFDFTSAINGSQELKNTLDYIGLSAEDVKNYFTQIGEVVTNIDPEVEQVNPIETYSAMTESISSYNDILEKTNEILGDNTEVTQEYKDSIIDLIGSEEDVNDCFDDNNKLVVKNAKKLKDLVAQNVRLKKAQSQLDYYNLVKQLNATLNGTKKLDSATRDSIYALLKQIDTVELAIYQYQQLEDSLLGATNAFDEFAKAQEIDALNTYGDSYVEMVQTMYDAMYKNGQVGTEAFWASVEALVPDEVYQGLKSDADKMKAIYDYYNKNILPTLKLDEDQISFDQKSIEHFVKKGIGAGVFTGTTKDFDLVEGMNLEEAAKLLGYTKTQAYAFFAELDKYNVSGTELSFLQQLDDSFEGRITKTVNKMEELNREKLALLEDGGYEKNKTAIDDINKQLSQCDKNLESAGVEAYNMWQAYSKNDVALNAMSAIEDKQQKITKEGAATLGLEWDEVKGKTIQQVYDEILAKQQELGTPTELTVQFAKENVESALDDLENKLKEKDIDIEANVIWNDEKEQFEAVEGSAHANDKDLQEYIRLSNEDYVLGSYLEEGLTATEEYLSNIQEILQNIYDVQTGKEPEDSKPENETPNENVAKETSGSNAISSAIIDSFANNSDSLFTSQQYQDIAAFFTDTVPEVAGNVAESIGKFFTETVPQEWNEFWAEVGKSLSEFGKDVKEVYGIVNNFFTETVPAAWNEYWAEVGESLDEFGNNVQAVYDTVRKFFSETIPQKWDEFWEAVDKTVFEDVPFAIGYVVGVATKFFTKTIPEKWDEFWNEVEETWDDITTGAKELYDVVSTFFTETIPEKWNEFWDDVGDFFTEVIEPAVQDVINAISTFFNDTLPTKWNEFWNSVTTFFTTTIPNAAEEAKNAVIEFFTVTIPTKWNEFWDSVGQFISENIIPALSALQNKIKTFFTKTIPEKWNGLWDAVSNFITKTIPAALSQLGNKVISFFTKTIPAKWSGFWSSVSNTFVKPIQTAVSTIKKGITTFFTTTVPNAISGMWSSLSSWISQKASEVWKNLTSGFNFGFNDGNDNNGGNGGSGGINGNGPTRVTRVDGTAHAHGTADNGGSWGAPKTETALVGELGPEILVRGSRWTTVGDNGAEFTQVKKGDIIFNHKQSESLLKNGYVTGRGKLHGGAFASGTAYSGLWNPVSPNTSQSNKPGKDFSDIGDKLYDAADSLSTAGDDISDGADEFREVFDWIEVRLEEINDGISFKNAELGNAVGYDNQNEIVDSLIALNENLYDNLKAGYDEYNSYAKKLLAKIPAAYQQAAQDGSIAIETFAGEADEKTLEAIQEYREWAQKATSAATQAEETIAEISSLAKQAIDNIAADYENQASLRENKINQLDAYNALTETTYGTESQAIYKELIQINKKNIDELEKQRDKMQKELNAQVSSGSIQKYSQDWYDAINDIASLDTEIVELTVDLNNLQDTINSLHWEHFDNLMSRFEMVSSEAENLIDILDTKDVVDEMGNWTDEGITMLGLYAQKMEVAEMQVSKYKEEIDDLNANWKSLGYTEQEYVEKLDELKSAQYDAINAYNDTKDAIVDLTSERVEAIKKGIEKEIDAYEKLIEKKKEELDAEKDLHDFHKDVMDQQKDISDIQRKLDALSADNSAAARAKKAQLEAELVEAMAALNETYYDRSINDQQEALDTELDNFTTTKEQEIAGWEEYLTNVEVVVADALAVVQANTDAVYQTLKAMGKEYSLDITESLTSPWENGAYAIQSFSEKFGLSMSSTVEELRKLSVAYKEVMREIENAGNTAINNVNSNANKYTSAQNTSSSNKKPSTSSTNKNKNTTTSTSNKTPAVSSTITVGGKINAGNALIYQSSSGSGGGVQYFKNDPIYTVIQESNGYILVRHHSLSSGYTGWFKKSDVKALATGTTSLNKSGIVNVDELGDELIIRAQNGRLTYMEKGSGVVPADLTSNLMEWGKLDPTSMIEQNRPVITAPVVQNKEVNIDLTYGDILHIEEFHGDDPDEISKIVAKQFEKHTKNLNNAIRKFAR